MKKNWNKIAKLVLNFVGGQKNVLSFLKCQTRLRINVTDLSKVKKEKLKNVEESLGINIIGQQVQVIFGTGKVVKIANAFNKITGIKEGEDFEDLNTIASKNKEVQKGRNTSAFQRFIGKFSNIFAPLIIGFIGAGILSGLSGIIKSATDITTNATAKSWVNIFAVLLAIWKGTFLVIVGWRTAETFGGSGVLGAIIGGLYVAAFAASVNGVFVSDGKGGFNFLGGHISNAAHNWFTVGFRPYTPKGQETLLLSYPSGSIFGVMISAGLIGLLEKGFRKFIPGVLDTVLTPTLVLIILLALNFVLIIPVSGYVFSAVSFLFQNLYGNPFGAALLAGLFLITVVFGIHQGFVPVYAALLASTKVNGLFPILGMAGAGQVGMAIALWARGDKKGKLRKQIQGAILPGFLGIGEPLIYGVSLPRVKPFITASIGGAIGGFFMGAINLWTGDPVGLNTLFGPSGLLAIPLMTSVSGSIVKGISVYLGGLVISYLGGFVTTYFLGYKNVDLT